MKYINGNPYDYNYISVTKKQAKRRDEKVELSPTAEAVINHPACNFVAKFMGIDTKKEWSQFYDKVYFIYKWAKNRTGSNDLNHLISVIKEKLNASPEMSERRIDDLYIAIKIEQEMKGGGSNGKV